MAGKALLGLIRDRADMHRCMNMVFLRIAIPRRESKEEQEREKGQFSASKSFKDICGIMNHLFETLHALYIGDFKHWLLGQDFISFEYVVKEGLVDFYIVAPHHLVHIIEKQLTGFFPEAYIEKLPEYNLFKPNNKTFGSYLKLLKHYKYPIRTYQRMDSDPLNGIVNALSKIDEKNETAAIQIVVRAAKKGWQKKGRKMAEKILEHKKESWLTALNPLTWVETLMNILVHGPTPENLGSKEQQGGGRTTPLTDDQIKAIEEKNTKPGFHTVIRIIVNSPTEHAARKQWKSIESAFAQHDTTDNNCLEYTKYHSIHQLAKNFLYRTMKRNWTQRLQLHGTILSTEELASIFHLPNIVYNRTNNINWQNYKVSPAPSNIPTEGILLGHNIYRSEVKEIRMKNEDRFRHFYVIGQTGTGKSSILQVMIRQDLQNGNGLCVIDPHGQLIDDILPFIPRERADDVIFFNPGDLERPMGLNMLEADSEEEKELVAMDAMNIMIKLFNEEIFGPRIQDYFRNGCLTLMADQDGASLTDIVRLFTDDDYQAYKVTKVKNPVVKSFWEHQMAKTGAREKAEMIPYFAAKFGQFITNTMMRNIIGQTRSAFDFFKVMQEGKILLMNLSKGETGEINSKLLGLITVSKIQMAALKRQKVSKENRRDFFLYIDEFQNYVTDSIEVILSEARKYRLGLNMAHQYLGQLEGEQSAMKKGQSKLKDAVFGNVGSIMCYKIGAQDAEFLAKEMAPVFSDQDLINIDKYKAVMKLSVDTQPSRPFSVIPVNPYTEKGDKEAAEAYKQLSRLKYGRDKEFVDREVLRRMGVI